MINITHKKYELGDATFHHLIFKNLVEDELQELYDSVANILFNLKITLVQQFFIGNTKLVKKIKKTEKQTFDERDWPFCWLNQANSKTISGHFTGISGTTVKGITGSKFASKIIDTNDFRYGIIGDIYLNNIDSSAPLADNLKMALAFNGCEPENIIQTNIFTDNKTDIKDNTLPDTGTNNILNISNHQNKPALISSEVFLPKSTICSISVINEGCIIKHENHTLLKLTFSNNLIDSEKEITALLANMADFVSTYKITWKNLQLAYVFATNTNQIKLVKTVCKEMKIPLSALLFIVLDSGKQSSLCINAEFSI